MTWCRTITIAAAAVGLWFVLTGQPQTRKLILVAAVLSAAWVWFYNYDYNSPDQIKIGRLNVMTWVAWTVGLAFAGMWWFWLQRSTELTFIQRIGLTAVVWTIAIMIIEYIGYNYMNIQLTSNYPGLFGLELIHGPRYLQFYYLTAWVWYLIMLSSVTECS